MAKQNSVLPKNFDWHDFLYILILLVTSGILGGVVNYYLNLKGISDDKDSNFPLRSIVVGIGAAVLVPIFLEITQSKVLEGVVLHQLVPTVLLVSFCVLAATTSFRFISSVSDSVMSRIKEVEKQAEDASRKADVSVRAIEQRGGTRVEPKVMENFRAIAANVLGGNTEDPVKGHFGGISKNQYYELQLAHAEAIEAVTGWFNLTFRVRAIDPASKELGGEAIFFLHPTFKPNVVPVKLINGVAFLTRIAWGAFTIGVELPDGSKLEYDLAENQSLPEEFRNR